ncbi:MAG: hypothetical protein ACR2MM_11055 [Flavobacteriaceae bacterium]
MRRILYTGLVLLLLSCNNDESPAELQIHAGYQKDILSIPNGPEVNLAIWYPTLEEERSYIYNTAASQLDLSGTVAENSAVADGLWPLIIFSHGFSGGGIGSAEICESLARAGYVVVAPDHSDAVISVRVEGTASGTISDALNYLENNPFGDGSDYLYRLSEIQGLIAHFTAQSSFNINPAQLILGGHSMGGWTVMKAVENGSRPTAAFLFSMGELNWLFAGQRYYQAEFFEGLDFPTAYYYGEDEYGQAVNNGRENVYAAYCFTHSPSPSYGLIVENGNHFTYNSQAVAPQSHGDASQLESITSRLIRFLDKYVKGEETTVTQDPLDVHK